MQVTTVLLKQSKPVLIKALLVLIYGRFESLILFQIKDTNFLLVKQIKPFVVKDGKVLLVINPANPFVRFSQSNFNS
jgi:hypothetical protein